MSMMGNIMALLESSPGAAEVMDDHLSVGMKELRDGFGGGFEGP